MTTFHDKYIQVQQEVQVPKKALPKANYKARSAEQILEVAKPIAHSHGLSIRLSDDELIVAGTRIFIKATAIISDGEDYEQSSSIVEVHDRPVSNAGNFTMNESQASGSTSSYARKYALQGLLGLDDGKDADSKEASHEYNNSYSGQSYTPKVASDKQINFAQTLLDKADKDVTRAWFKEQFGSKKLSELTSKEAAELIEYLLAKPGAIDDISQYSDETF